MQPRIFKIYHQQELRDFYSFIVRSPSPSSCNRLSSCDLRSRTSSISKNIPDNQPSPTAALISVTLAIGLSCLVLFLTFLAFRKLVCPRSSPLSQQHNSSSKHANDDYLRRGRCSLRDRFSRGSGRPGSARSSHSVRRASCRSHRTSSRVDVDRASVALAPRAGTSSPGSWQIVKSSFRGAQSVPGTCLGAPLLLLLLGALNYWFFGGLVYYLSVLATSKAGGETEIREVGVVVLEEEIGRRFYYC